VSALAWGISGFGATVILTLMLVAAQGLGLTRMSLPYLLGTMFTPDRDRARLVGVVVHLLNGWIFSLVYFAAFAVAGRAIEAADHVHERGLAGAGRAHDGEELPLRD
jgi:hypothetical protein